MKKNLLFVAMAATCVIPSVCAEDKGVQAPEAGIDVGQMLNGCRQNIKGVRSQLAVLSAATKIEKVIRQHEQGIRGAAVPVLRLIIDLAGVCGELLNDDALMATVVEQIMNHPQMTVQGATDAKEQAEQEVRSQLQRVVAIIREVLAQVKPAAAQSRRKTRHRASHTMAQASHRATPPPMRLPDQ